MSALVCSLCWLWVWVARAEEAPLSELEQLIVQALAHNASIDVATARVQLAEAQAKEVTALKMPKFTATTWVAPMFTVQGSALTEDVERDYSPDAWGPYAHVEAMLVAPISTFGRVKAGKQAADAWSDIARYQVQSEQNEVVAQVREMYYQRLFTLQAMPVLDRGAKLLAEASEQAETLYQQGTGAISQIDRMRLRYGVAELARLRRFIVQGDADSAVGLKHLLGLPADAELPMQATSLPKLRNNSLGPIEQYLDTASRCRPEFAQLSRGSNGLAALRKSEKRSLLPIFFVAGTLRADWTPTRTNASNPYHYDPYNGFTAGVAAGFRFDIDIAKMNARVAQVDARMRAIQARARLAETGLMAQVRVAYGAAQKNWDIMKYTERGVKATRKWVTTAATAFFLGTGEAKDLVEGVVANLTAERNRLEAVMNYLIAEAFLDRAIGVGRGTLNCTRPGAHDG